MNESLSTYKNRSLLGWDGCDIKMTGFYYLFTSTRECCIFSFLVKDRCGNPKPRWRYRVCGATISPFVPLLRLQSSLSYIRLLRCILPVDSDKASLYRLVLEHGDFGIHNMSITLDANSRPLVTFVYDWETGHHPACYLIPSVDEGRLWSSGGQEWQPINRSNRGGQNSGGPRRAHEMCEGILQGMFCVQAISFLVYEQRSNCILPRRLSTNRHPCTNVQYMEGKDARHLWYSWKKLARWGSGKLFRWSGNLGWEKDGCASRIGEIKWPLFPAITFLAPSVAQLILLK